MTDSATETTRGSVGPRNGFDRYFEITARGSTVGREVRGGLATFFTMAYIVVLNPLILGAAVDGDGDKLPIAAVAAATALVAGVMTILMGVVGPLPARAGRRAGRQRARRVRDRAADDLGRRDGPGGHRGRASSRSWCSPGCGTRCSAPVPTQLKTAIGVGIGLFLALIGFVDAGFVRGRRRRRRRSGSASAASWSAGRRWSSCSACCSRSSWSSAR